MKKYLFTLMIVLSNLLSFGQNSNNQPYVIVIPREQLYSPAPAAPSPAPAPAPAPAKPTEPPKAPAPPRRYYELAFKFSPTVTSNYVEGINEFSPMIEDGTAGRITLGPIVDIFFVDYKYAFSTGLWYTVKHANFLGTSVINPTYTDAQLSKKVSSSYNVQYAQVPISFKFVSAPILRLFSCYVQFGGTFDYKIAEKPLFKESNVLYKYVQSAGRKELFHQTNFGLLIGTGIYQRVNSQNALILGVSYNRDLFNAVRDPNLISRSNIFAFDIGMVF
jgi:hypothetical protein